jgi:hypothetical protein
MEELIEKVKDLNDDKLFQKKLEENESINLEMFKIKKDIIIFLTKNKLENDKDLIQLKAIIDFIVKTGRVRYSYKKKLERMNMLINKFI